MTVLSLIVNTMVKDTIFWKWRYIYDAKYVFSIFFYSNICAFFHFFINRM